MLTAVLVCVLLVVALLAIPLSLSYDVSTRPGYRNDVVIGWAFGLLRLRLPTERPARAAAHGKPSSAKKSSAGRSDGFAALRQRAFRRRLLRFASDLWRAVHKHDVRLNVRLGLGDPADTGQLWAIVGPIAGVLSRTEGAAISIVPEFFDATLELDSRGSVRLVPLQILGLALALLLSPPVWRGLRAMQRAG